MFHYIWPAFFLIAGEDEWGDETLNIDIEKNLKNDDGKKIHHRHFQNFQKVIYLP